jgi:hypothetical protein
MLHCAVCKPYIFGSFMDEILGQPESVSLKPALRIAVRQAHRNGSTLRILRNNYEAIAAQWSSVPLSDKRRAVLDFVR